MEGLYILKNGEVTPYEFNKEIDTILVGVPGAFTPTCTDYHLPGYAKNLEMLKGYKVVFFAGNDCSTMDAWNKLYGHPDIDAVSDDKAIFSQSIDEAVDFGPTYSWRTNRCAYLVKNGKIGKKFKNPFIDGVLDELEIVSDPAAQAEYQAWIVAQNNAIGDAKSQREGTPIKTPDQTAE
jgi:peroxiredoxin